MNIPVQGKKNEEKVCIIEAFYTKSLLTEFSSAISENAISVKTTYGFIQLGTLCLPTQRAVSVNSACCVSQLGTCLHSASAMTVHRFLQKSRETSSSRSTPRNPLVRASVLPCHDKSPPCWVARSNSRRKQIQAITQPSSYPFVVESSLVLT